MRSVFGIAWQGVRHPLQGGIPHLAKRGPCPGPWPGGIRHAGTVGVGSPWQILLNQVVRRLTQVSHHEPSFREVSVARGNGLGSILFNPICMSNLLPEHHSPTITNTIQHHVSAANKPIID